MKADSCLREFVERKREKCGSRWMELTAERREGWLGEGRLGYTCRLRRENQRRAEVA